MNINNNFTKLENPLRKFKLSIIVPVYNCQDYVEKCLDSLFLYKTPEVQIVVVNDGSVDETDSILSKFDGSDGYVHVVTGNLGVSAARNKGISLSEGSYLWFVDADDFIDPLFMRYLLELLSRKKSLDLILFGSIKVKKFKNEKSGFPNNLLMENMGEIGDNFDFVFSKIIYNVLWNKIFKKKIILEKDIFFSDLKTGEDADFVTRYISSIKNCFVSNKIPYYYQLESTSSTRDNHSALKEFKDNSLRIQRQIFLFDEMGISGTHVNCNSILHLIFGTYRLIFSETEKCKKSNIEFSKMILKLTNTKTTLLKYVQKRVSFNDRILYFFVTHPKISYYFFFVRTKLNA